MHYKKKKMSLGQTYNESIAEQPKTEQQQAGVRCCPQCGTPNAVSAMFCKKCGTKFN